jgi:hypothetical protein
MKFVITDMPQHGVMIHGPESLGFRERLLALVKVPPELEDDALRFSVVVENRTPQNILYLDLVWSPYSQEDSKYVSKYDLRDGNEYLRLMRSGLMPVSLAMQVSIGGEFTQMSWGMSRPLIKAGAQSPWSLLEGADFLNRKIDLAKNEARLKEKRDRVKAQFARIARWSVDVDGVLFSDGVFAGQDTSLWFDSFEAKVRATRDFIAELNRKLDDGEDAFAYAEQCASITIEQIEAIYPTPLPGAREYALSKKVGAMGVIMRRQKSGEQATVEWVRASAKSQIPLVRR